MCLCVNPVLVWWPKIMSRLHVGKPTTHVTTDKRSLLEERRSSIYIRRRSVKANWLWSSDLCMSNRTVVSRRINPNSLARLSLGGNCSHCMLVVLRNLVVEPHENIPTPVDQQIISSVTTTSALDAPIHPDSLQWCIQWEHYHTPVQFFLPHNEDSSKLKMQHENHLRIALAVTDNQSLFDLPSTMSDEESNCPPSWSTHSNFSCYDPSIRSSTFTVGSSIYKGTWACNSFVHVYVVDNRVCGFCSICCYSCFCHGGVVSDTVNDNCSRSTLPNAVRHCLGLLVTKEVVQVSSFSLCTIGGVGGVVGGGSGDLRSRIGGL